jgi:hypothetical protein
MAANDQLPTTTVSEPEPPPEPAPDPAPVPTPAPKPKPKPKPIAAAPRAQPVERPRPSGITPNSGPVAPSRTTVQRSSRPTVQRPSRPAVKKRIVRKKNRQKLQLQRQMRLPTAVAPDRARSGVAGVRASSKLASAGSGIESLLFVATIGLAIICLGVAAVPGAYVPWRPAAYFVSVRHLDLAMAGLALLFVAGFVVLLAGGP